MYLDIVTINELQVLFLRGSYKDKSVAYLAIPNERTARSLTFRMKGATEPLLTKATGFKKRKGLGSSQWLCVSLSCSLRILF